MKKYSEKKKYKWLRIVLNVKILNSGTWNPKTGICKSFIHLKQKTFCVEFIIEFLDTK